MTTITTTSNNDPPEMLLAGGMRLAKWCKLVGISTRTARRYSKAGKLKVIVRYGQSYITREGIAEFFTNDGTTTRTVPSQ